MSHDLIVHFESLIQLDENENVLNTKEPRKYLKIRVQTVLEKNGMKTEDNEKVHNADRASETCSLWDPIHQVVKWINRSHGEVNCTTTSRRSSLRIQVLPGIPLQIQEHEDLSECLT